MADQPDKDVESQKTESPDPKEGVADVVVIAGDVGIIEGYVPPRPKERQDEDQDRPNGDRPETNDQPKKSEKSE